MRAASVLFLVLTFALRTSGQDTTRPDVWSPYAVATIQVAKHAFKAGEDIEVTVLLVAGPLGVYVAKGWSEAGGGVAGFLVRSSSQTCGHAGDTLPQHEPDTAKILERSFVFLGPGEIIGWRTRIPCTTRRPGRYVIEASYSPDRFDTDRVARVPETRGLVLVNAIVAKPVEISIY